MKKILFLLLLSIAGYGQTSTGQEQEFDYGIKNNSTQTITTPTYIGTFGTDGTQGKIPSAYIEKTDNKQNSLAVDGTGVKYPTVDAVNAALPKSYSQIVYVNSTNPNTATIFDTANPPITNDNGLKVDTDNLYIGTDASTWVYDGIVFNYVTKSLPAISNFYLGGSTADAGSDKVQPIKRNGTIESTGFIKTGGTSSQFLMADGSTTTSAGAGTVTSVSVVTANGVSGSVATATTTPAITLSLGAITPTSTNGVSATTMAYNDATSSIQTQLNAKASLASPALTGAPTAPTATAGTNTTQIATTAFVLANASGGSGDMVLATAQTVTGEKTFLNTKLALRNVANTFSSYFTNSNTAARTYALQNRDGTLLDNTDLSTINTNIAAKMANPAGTANYLSKFLTATTIGLSRIWDTGTFLGIGTVSSPKKDLTFGNQTDREVGIEESNSLNKGMDLFIRAGRTINYAPNSNFNLLTSLTATETVITVAPNGNVYLAAKSGDIYMQTGGSGNFVPLGQTSRNWAGISAAPNGNVYATNNGGDIYMQTGGTGNFVPLGQTSRNWYGISAAPNGNVYAVVFGGDIYMQTGGTGNFVPLGQTSRNWWGITVAPNGNVYACGDSIGIYMQTSGSGTFNSLGQASKNWRHISAAPSGNVYAAAAIDNIYMQTAGTGNFATLGQSVLFWFGIAVAPNGNVYATNNSGQVYIQYNFALGNPNLDGGTYKAIAGTGKGTGSSNQEFYTGQKTTSGTDMQIETLRMKIDNEGKTTFYGITTIGVYTVATLPTPTGTAYATVSDALAPAYMATVVGGGAVVTPVFYNGTNWVAH